MNAIVSLIRTALATGIALLTFAPFVVSQQSASTPKPQPRARDLGIPFDGSSGPFNAITDVAGVEVGYATLISS